MTTAIRNTLANSTLTVRISDNNIYSFKSTSERTLHISGKSKSATSSKYKVIDAHYRSIFVVQLASEHLDIIVHT